MAWIEADAIFDPDTMSQSIIGIASKLVRHDSGLHRHQKGQILFAERGCMKILMTHQFAVVPPQRLVWIPQNTLHRVFFNEVVDYRSIYIDTNIYDFLPIEPTVWTSRPLSRAILEEIALSEWNTDWLAYSRGYHWLQVLWDELATLVTEKQYLIFPTHYRFKNIDFINEAPPLIELANRMHASERTVTRIFYKETGMTYQSWRQQWRLLKAIELLSQDYSLLDIALELGFKSDSAFSTFFKNQTGVSPRLYT